MIIVAACSSQAPQVAPPAAAPEPPPAEVSTIVVPIRASLAPLLPLIEAQVPKSAIQLDAYELDPSQRFGLKWKVLRDPIALSMQNAGLHSSAHVRYALEGCVNGSQRMWPCISCGFGEPMREATIELQSRFEWAENWTLRSKTTARPVDFGTNPCRVTPLNINITEWKLRPLVEEQLRDVAKTIDQNTPKLASMRPYAQQVWAGLRGPFSIGPNTWLVIEPEDVALTPIHGAGIDVMSSLVLHARTRVIFGAKPLLAAKPLPALRTANVSNEGIRVPFDVEIPWEEVSSLLTREFGHHTYPIEGGTLVVDTLRLAATPKGKLRLEAAIDYRGGGLKKYRGLVYLEGVAKFDERAGQMTVDDVDYSIDPKHHSFVGAMLDRIAHDRIRTRLRAMLHWSIAPEVGALRKEIESGVTRNLAPGINLRGRVDSVEPVSVTSTANGVVIRVIAVGSANVDVTAFR